MGKQDVVTKEYVRNPEIFADICNYILFNGKNVIQPENLSEVDTIELIMKHRKTIQKSRDLLKHWVMMESGEATIAILGIENQTDIDYAMVIRNYLYDAINYNRQVNDICQGYISKKGISKNTPKNKCFSKSDRVKPVITIVVYWGPGSWDGIRDLHGLIDFSKLPVEAVKYVNNYKIPILVPQEITDFDMFASELRYILPLVKTFDDKVEMKKVIDQYRDEFSKLNNKTAELISVLANIEIVEEDGECNMCKAFEELCNDAREEGREEGREESLEIVKLIKNGLCDTEISEKMGISIDEVIIVRKVLEC